VVKGGSRCSVSYQPTMQARANCMADILSLPVTSVPAQLSGSPGSGCRVILGVDGGNNFEPMLHVTTSRVALQSCDRKHCFRSLPCCCSLNKSYEQACTIRANVCTRVLSHVSPAHAPCACEQILLEYATVVVVVAPSQAHCISDHHSFTGALR
jgi:hypothetical protein